MACDTLGRPIRFLIAPGQSHDILAIPALLEGHRPKAVLADRAYDANSLRARLAEIGAEAVIPSTRSRKTPIPHNPLIYKLRNRVERCFNKLKTSDASPPGSTASPDTTSPSCTSPAP